MKDTLPEKYIKYSGESFANKIVKTEFDLGAP